MAYCPSRFRTIRRPSREVFIGGVGVGGPHPLRIQSMTTSDTQDVAATVQQAIALAEVGCEIVRVTAPNLAAAKCLKEIRARLGAAGFAHVPLVADIHFLPAAALEAVEHVEKVRVNPGNYADKKRFAVREYTDAEYEREIQRLHESFSPLVQRCRALGRSMRIGTNHGSLSDRIMNRYGDTPLGMVESALEFIRIAEDNDFHALVLSMKASNPKVMIEAYRLLVERMGGEDMHYPLHLGVTEAGDGEDGRIKSAIGIGSLLVDGLGDTIRVSLTEDSVYEIPVAQALARKTMALWSNEPAPLQPEEDGVNPYQFARREILPVDLGPGVPVHQEQPPRVLAHFGAAPENMGVIASQLRLAKSALKDTPLEGLVVHAADGADAARILASAQVLEGLLPCLIVELPREAVSAALAALPRDPSPRIGLFSEFAASAAADIPVFIEAVSRGGALPVVGLPPSLPNAVLAALETLAATPWIATLTLTPLKSASGWHTIGTWRRLRQTLRGHRIRVPLWIRNTPETSLSHDPAYLSRLLEGSILTGSLLCDGMGDLVSLETEGDLVRATKLAYNILQGAGSRISRTEFVACPSCGRTLFDLQSTTQRIRARTGHLKGVKIAIMGCIVNGPGEMADADFGYVGGAPGRINLYVGKKCVRYNIPQAEADQRLVELIREHGKWIDPEQVETVSV